MDRHNHYEAAFAAFLRERKVCHLAINETRRSYLGDSPAKSVDFLVHGHCGERFVVDIKGRRYPGGTREHPKRTWQSWVTKADVEDARHWAAKLGPGFRAIFVFTYHLTDPEGLDLQRETAWTWQHRYYLVRAIPVEEYARHMRVRSPKWSTVHLATPDFHRMARPLHEFLLELRWSDHPRLTVIAS
jgi:hypothetical protein